MCSFSKRFWNSANYFSYIQNTTKQHCWTFVVYDHLHQYIFLVLNYLHLEMCVNMILIIVTSDYISVLFIQSFFFWTVVVVFLDWKRHWNFWCSDIHTHLIYIGIRQNSILKKTSKFMWLEQIIKFQNVFEFIIAICCVMLMYIAPTLSENI